MKELPFATRLVQLPVALVASLVDPHHGAAAMTQATLPLTCVNCPRAVGENLELWLGVLHIPTSQCFSCFITLEIFAMQIAIVPLDAVATALEPASNERLDSYKFHHFVLLSSLS